MAGAPRPLALDVEVTRGDVVESRHRVHAAVIGPGDALMAVSGAPDLVTMWRSCAKPFQVLPFLASGGFDQLGWGAPQLALACASHGGEPEHVALAAKMLDAIGLEEGDLACGPHEPMAPRGVKLGRDMGVAWSRLHNNCSGKHAAMLARAFTASWPIAGYERTDHPVQKAVLAEVASWTGVSRDDMALGVDGCGVTVMGLPLDRMALAYARWARAVAGGDELPARTAAAIAAHPHLFGGTDRLDTVVVDETRGAVITKVGAEGVHCAAVPAMGLGLAIKVEDGATRAQYVAILRALQLVGALPDPLPARLADFQRRPIRNTRGEVVGEVRVATRVAT
ncbi:MAG TPA: asparaginase [Gemmatimonadaceae bacterium]|nr:asparaginase [Gemmatimonadaceae bacterium]